MVVREDGNAESDASLLGALAERPEEDFRAGRLAEACQEMVLGEPEAVEPHLVSEGALLQCVLVKGMSVVAAVVVFWSLDLKQQCEFQLNPPFS